ncbi:hypothetical protein [Janthinobacterium sp. RB2R34]|uniref:hypothetical protein n=1 Tax=Janthinobacterium sp. RB2R34 TaxID=3424193 RepID=UPI003F210EC0
MAYYVELILLVSGIIGITLGYRRNDRKTMLAAAWLLYVSATGGQPLVDFAHGLHDGFYGGKLTQGEPVAKG